MGIKFWQVIARPGLVSVLEIFIDSGFFDALMQSYGARLQIIASQKRIINSQISQDIWIYHKDILNMSHLKNVRYLAEFPRWERNGSCYEIKLQI